MGPEIDTRKSRVAAVSAARLRVSVNPPRNELFCKVISSPAVEKQT